MAIDRGRRAAQAASAVLLALVGPVAAQETPASPPPDRPPVELALPSPAPVDRASHLTRGRVRPTWDRDSVGAGRLKGWRALSLKEGQGQLLINGVSQSVKPGQAVDAYIVKAVSPGRIVLEGAAAPSAPGGARGSVLAIVTFDAQGTARVQMVFDADPTASLTAQPRTRSVSK